MLTQALRHMHLQYIPILCLSLIAIVFSLQASTLPNSTSLERIVGLNTSNDALLPPSLQFPQQARSSNLPALTNEPRYTCKVPYTPMSLNYTLGASLSKSAIGALVVSAQRYVQVQLNLGHGSDRIHHTLPGRFWRFKADLVLYASDFGSGDALTWSELFQAIDLVRYCGFERRIYLEMFADVYVRFARVGHIVVKLARSPSLGADSLVTE
ncbi:MAG: hypothetical protein Q9175_001323 [Cornicularia normoerica]